MDLYGSELLKFAPGYLPLPLNVFTGFCVVSISFALVRGEDAGPGSPCSWKWKTLDYVQKVRMKCPTLKECTFSFWVSFPLYG